MVIFDIHRCLFIINTRHFKYVARAKECIKKEAWGAIPEPLTFIQTIHDLTRNPVLLYGM